MSPSAPLPDYVPEPRSASPAAVRAAYTAGLFVGAFGAVGIALVAAVTYVTTIGLH